MRKRIASYAPPGSGRFPALALLVSLWIGAASVPAAAQEDDGPVAISGVEPPALIEEIVVTARRRQEFLEDTPVSVTAIGGDRLARSQVVALDQMESLVPNMVFTRSFTGTVSEIRIRGVGTSAIDGIFDPGVGVYLDGVYLARTGGQVFDVVDFEELDDGVQRGVGRLNLRLGYVFNDDRTEIALWGRNVTDERVFSAVLSIANVAGVLSRFHDPPATFGLELRHEF